MTETPDSDTGATRAIGPAEWWAGLRDGRVLLNRCRSCGAAWIPWMAHCPDCGRHGEVEVTQADGRGTVYSWVVVTRSASSPDDVPFTVLSVRLDEGAMVYGRLARSVTAPPTAEMPVRAVISQRDGGDPEIAFEQA